MSQLGPRSLLDLTNRGQPEKTGVHVGDPQISVSVLDNAAHHPAGNAAHGNKPAVLQVTKRSKRRDPNSSTTVPKKRTIKRAIQFPGALVIRGNSRVIPSIQAFSSAQQDAPIIIRENG